MGHPVDEEEYQEKVQLFFSSSSSSSVASASSSSSEPSSLADSGHPLEPSLTADLPPPPAEVPPTNPNPLAVVTAGAGASVVDAVAVVSMRRGVPAHWRPIYALTDPEEDVVVVTFDTNRPCDF